MEKGLTGLKIDKWYHVFVVLGAAGAIASVSFELKGVANAHVLIASLGVLFVGIGEWINHPLQTAILPPNAYLGGGGILSGHPRSPSLLGSLFDLLGFVLLVVGVWKILDAA
jgi:hypothetical protein